MKLTYNLGVRFFEIAVKLSAFSGNKKAALWLEGRRDWRANLTKIKADCRRPVLWMHVASLGEYEMGAAVLDRLRENFDVVVSVFSPSAFEVLKSKIKNLIYLPLSTTINARDFVSILNPDIAIFVKYDLWFHYLHELNRRNKKLFLICASFKKHQLYFRSLGSFVKEELKKFSHIFTLDRSTLVLLKEHKFSNYSFAGDTRCDRVIENRETAFSDKKLVDFCAGHKVLICGSTWPEDEAVLFATKKWLSTNNYKLIIAPHEISEQKLFKLKSFGNGCFYSEKRWESSVLIIDTIGILKFIYRFAHIAYVGGAFKQGLHNILEPAAYGIPVIYGPRLKKFPEATALMEEGGGFSIFDSDELLSVLKKLNNENFYRNSAKASKQFVIKSSGASRIISDFILMENR